MPHSNALAKIDRESELESPRIVDVPKKLLTMEDGRASDLHIFLMSIGCTIFPGGKSPESRMVMHASPELAKLMDDAVEKYAAAYMSNPDAPEHERDVQAWHALEHDTDVYVDEMDFEQNMAVLRPISLREIGEFIGSMGRIRVGENGELIRSKNASHEIQLCKKATLKLYEKIAVVLAEEQQRKFASNIDKTSEGVRGEISKISRITDRLPKKTEHEKLLRSFEGKSFAEISHLLTNKYHINEKEKIENPTVMNNFAQIRTFHRKLNNLAGIDTKAEIAKLAEEDKKVKEDKHKAEPMRIFGPGKKKKPISGTWNAL